MAEVNVGDRQGEVVTRSDDDGRKALAGDDSQCVLRAPVCDVGGVAVTMRRTAKDKRNMREKRRSTGRVSYTDTSDGQSSPANDDGDDAGADDETDRNTSYNETPIASVDRRTSTTTSGMTSDSAAGQCPTSTSDQSGTSPAPAVSLSSVADAPTNRSTEAPATAVRPTAPVVPPKPKVCSQPAGSGRSPWQPRPPSEKTSTTTVGQEDHSAALLARVHALEKVVHEANTENFRLKEMLLMRENRIAELETEVEALNKDLDFADEDYEKLEEKNAALVRVVAQMSPR